MKPEEIAASLPDILFHLESFDQDQVRSAIPCYFTACLASQEVEEMKIPAEFVEKV